MNIINVNIDVNIPRRKRALGHPGAYYHIFEMVKHYLCTS